MVNVKPNIKDYPGILTDNSQSKQFKENDVKNKQKINELVSDNSVGEHVLVRTDKKTTDLTCFCNTYSVFHCAVSILVSFIHN